MLVLSRKTDQRIQIGSDVTITVVRLHGGVVRLGIEAPSGVKVLRGELAQRELEAVAAGRPDERAGPLRRLPR